MKKCEQHVADHKAYDVTYAAASQYAADARAKYAACETLSSCLEDLQTRQTVVQVRARVPSVRLSCRCVCVHVLEIATLQGTWRSMG